jgi:hypothetical protein
VRAATLESTRFAKPAPRIGQVVFAPPLPPPPTHTHIADTHSLSHIATSPEGWYARSVRAYTRADAHTHARTHADCISLDIYIYIYIYRERERERERDEGETREREGERERDERGRGRKRERERLQVVGVEDVKSFVRLLLDPSMFGDNDGG